MRWAELDGPDSELLCCRLPQLPLLGTGRGPGPGGRHPQRSGSHQHCVSKDTRLWGSHRPGSASWLCDLEQVLGLSGPLLKWECGLPS